MARCMSIGQKVCAAGLIRSSCGARHSACRIAAYIGPHARRSFCIYNALWQRRFTKDHEWVELSSDKKTCTVGITNHAATAIGDVTWVELPKVHSNFAAEDVLATIESVKAANEIYAPISGTVTEVNQALDEDPKLVNQDPEGNAWVVKMSVESSAEFDELLDQSAYKALVQEAKEQ